MILYGYWAAAAAIGSLLGAGFESYLRQAMLRADDAARARSAPCGTTVVRRPHPGSIDPYI
ncbi:hypothetical protein [Jiangella asiatica]|uniref:Uncharacterized protein n=1 Tax=Jiangella asiatica TaxID=2530372 RepID=A0A4R5D3R4_9ACTN|nr:hypothetical protein [Jiangella asiatica]TDE08012.1 hypothetical protein E1269_18925 [Jiangella asiatica]